MPSCLILNLSGRKLLNFSPSSWVWLLVYHIWHLLSWDILLLYLIFEVVLVSNICSGTVEGRNVFTLCLFVGISLINFTSLWWNQIGHNVYYLLTYCSTQFPNILLKNFSSVDLQISFPFFHFFNKNNTIFLSSFFVVSLSAFVLR